MPIDILGVGVVTAGGRNLDDTWKSVLSGEDLRRPLPKYMVAGSRTVHGYQIGRSDTVRFPGRLAFLAKRAADQALEMASQGRSLTMVPDAICVGSTSAGFYEAEQEEIHYPPRYLVDSLGRWYGTTRTFQTSQACAASGHAIALGADLIRYGGLDVVLVGGADELSASVIAAFNAVRLYGDQCHPYDVNRHGLALGEAAAFFVLARPGIGRAIAQLDGIGLSTDAVDAAAPDRAGISSAIIDALASSEWPDIQFICTHGTGTQLNDEVESQAIERLFGRPGPLVSSYKGSLGHPQGASGAVGMALAIKALQTQTAYPTVGIRELDPSIGVSVVQHPTPMKMSRVLCLSSGSWGANCALVVSEAPR